MANRYWVGGTAAWDGTAGTKWAATSGGTGGETVPTSADDVFFDAASTGTVTISAGNTGAKSITCTGFTGTITGTAAITIAGNLTLVVGTTFTYSGTITFSGTGTLTSAGKTLGAITISGSAITVTLGDALTSSGTITLTQGTLDSANYNITANVFSTSGTLTRTLTLGSSTVSVGAVGTSWNIASATNFTLNAGTSTINLTSVSPTFAGGGLTYYNVAYTATNTNSRAMSGANTFNNLTLPTRLAAGLSTFTLSASQTINGTLSINASGTNPLNRHFVISNALGTVYTLTCAAVSLVDIDFRDITIAGAAAPASGTRLGDCGGNSGFTFTTKTVYRVGTNASWGGSSSWATTSGGTGNNTNLPLAQDTAVIDDNTALTGTLSLSGYNMSAIDCTNRTTSITISHDGALTFYGSYKLSSAVTVAGTNAATFAGRGTMDFQTAGKTITYAITIAGITGTFNLLDALTFTSTLAVTLSSGTLNLNGYTCTSGSFATAAGTKNITFNGGTIVVAQSGTAFNNAAATGFTTTAGTGTGKISLTSATAKTFAGGGSTYNCTISNDGAGALTITGSNTFTTLANGVSPTSFLFTAGTTTTLTNWSILGTAGNLVTIGSVTAASHTLSKSSGTVNADYLSISRSTATGGATWNAGSNSTDGGNNSGWIFGPPPTPTSGGNFFFFR